MRTSQLALPQIESQAVYSGASETYSDSGNNLSQVSLASDMVFSDGVTLQTPAMSGSIAGGYTATIDVAVAGPVVTPTAPNTTLTRTPANPSLNPSPVFAFTSDQADATFEYSLDGAAYTLVTGAVGINAMRDSAAIEDWLGGIAELFDVDGDGIASAADGILALRYMFGIRGSELIAGVVDDGAARKTATQIENFLAPIT